MEKSYAQESSWPYLAHPTQGKAACSISWVIYHLIIYLPSVGWRFFAAQRDAAIVTPIPGTTRDILSLSLDIGGLPIIISDTAGLRQTIDIVEKIGVQRAYEAYVLFYSLWEPRLTSTLEQCWKCRYQAMRAITVRHPISSEYWINLGRCDPRGIATLDYIPQYLFSIKQVRPSRFWYIAECLRRKGCPEDMVSKLEYRFRNQSVPRRSANHS